VCPAFDCYAECHYASNQYAEGHDAFFSYAEYHVFYPNREDHACYSYAESRYADSHDAECRVIYSYFIFMLSDPLFNVMLSVTLLM
jgi:hypothetical protein